MAIVCENLYPYLSRSLNPMNAGSHDQKLEALRRKLSELRSQTSKWEDDVPDCKMRPDGIIARPLRQHPTSSPLGGLSLEGLKIERSGESQSDLDESIGFRTD